MDYHKKRARQAKRIRQFRKIHRSLGIFLFVFFFIIASTGLLLGWKKNSNGYLLAKTQRGTSTELKDWLPLSELKSKATTYLLDSVSAELSTKIDRIDVRPSKGVVKFTFEDHYYGLQIDGNSGNLLSIEKRRADFIENLHDGSILDKWLGIPGSWLKLIYTTIMGLALIGFTVTGFWLWYGPKMMRRSSKK